MTFKLSEVCASRLHERVDFDVLDMYADETINTLHIQMEQSDAIETERLRGAIEHLRNLKKLQGYVKSVLKISE